jgi:hypothetical protein
MPAPKKPLEGWAHRVAEVGLGVFLWFPSLWTKPKRTREAIMACWGIHVGFSMILVVGLIVADAHDAVGTVFFVYGFFGWIPLAIWVYPILLKKLK